MAQSVVKSENDQENEEVNDRILRRLLPIYYRRLFPHALYYKWLCYGDPFKFQRRELSFTLFRDMYIRHQSFDTVEQFFKGLQKKTPIRINIGAIYKLKPKLQGRRQLPALTPHEKELIFDVDINEYDRMRSCCSRKNICSKCWKFIAVAVKVLDRALREDFGYDKMLWVFSGRRGVHCIVADRQARELGQRERSALADYLQVLAGGLALNRVRLGGGPLHHSIERALVIIDQYFLTVLEEQKFLETNEKLWSFLRIIDDSIRPLFVEKMTNAGTSLERWQVFLSIFEKLKTQDRIPDKCKYLVEEIKLQYLYPRLDINVTKVLSNLLKSPFCIHPNTGKVCVPFDHTKVDDFDPTSVPTIRQLTDELSLYDALVGPPDKKATPKQLIKSKHYRFTSLNEYVRVFKKFVNSVYNN